MADQTIPLPDGTTADFPADWTPGMIQSKLWDQFPQWRPKGPVTAFTPWDPAQGQGNEATQEFPSYDAYLDQRKEQQRLGQAQGADQGPELPPVDELSRRPSLPPLAQRPGLTPKQQGLVAEQAEARRGVGAVAEAFLPGGFVEKALVPEPTPEMGGALASPMFGPRIKPFVQAPGPTSEFVHGAGRTLPAMASGMTSPENIPLVIGAVANPLVATAEGIYYGNQAIQGGVKTFAEAQVEGDYGKMGASVGQAVIGGTMLAPSAAAALAPRTLAAARARYAEAGRALVETVRPLVAARAAGPPAAAPTPGAPATASLAPTPLARLGTGIEAVENAHRLVSESGTVPLATVNRALNNLLEQLAAARRATGLAGQQPGITGAQPAGTAVSALETGAAAPKAAAEAAYLRAKKAAQDAFAAVLRAQAGVVDAQQAARAISAAASAASDYRTAIAGAVPKPIVTPTTAGAVVRPGRAAPTAPFSSLTPDAKFELLAQKNAAGAATYTPEELAFANAITRDPAQLARFNARRQEIEAHAKAGTAAPTPGGPSALQVSQPTPVLRDVPEQPVVSEEQVPTEGGPGRVPPGELPKGPGEQAPVAAPIEAAPAAALKPAATTPELPGTTPDFIQSTPSDYLAGALGKPELTQVKGTPFEGTILGVDPATATKESLVQFGVRGLDAIAALEGVSIKRTSPTGTRMTAAQKAEDILAYYQRINQARASITDPALATEQRADLENRLRIYDQARAIRLGLLKHRMAVASALEQGQPVPPSVLRHYPDLAKRYRIALPEPKPFRVEQAEPDRLAPADARTSLISPMEYKATMDALAKLEGENKPVPVLSQAEVDHLRDYTRTKAQSGQPLDLRDHALIELLYASGLRTTEARLIRATRIHRPTPADPHAWIDVAADTAKGGKQRFAPITQEALNALDRYMNVGRPALLSASTPPGLVFLSKSGGEIGPADVWRTVSGIGREAGLPSRIWTHMLRHTFASQALARGVPRGTIMEWLGHTREGTTTSYLHPDKPSDASLAEYEKFSGREPPPPAQPGQPSGFFPRQSEAQGLGEPSMPPTVEDVRRQRALNEGGAPRTEEDRFSPEGPPQGMDMSKLSTEELQNLYNEAVEKRKVGAYYRDQHPIMEEWTKGLERELMRRQGHEDRGPNRGDPPDIAQQASYQTSITGGSPHELPAGVDPGPPNFAQQIMEAAHRMRMTIRSANLPQKILGRFERDLENDRIYLANINNQRSAAHEISHGLDYQLFPAQAGLVKQLQRTLLERVSPHGVTGVTAGQLYRQLATVSEFMRGPLDVPYRKRASELVADWGSLYLHDPVRARTMAPDFARGFENALRKDVSLQETINQLHAHDVKPIPGDLDPGVSSVTMEAVETPEHIGQRPQPAPPPHLQQIALAAQTFVKNAIRTLAVEEQRGRLWADSLRRDLTKPKKVFGRTIQIEDVDARKDVGAFIEGTGRLDIQGDDIGSVQARMTKAKNDAVLKVRHGFEFQRQRLNQYLRGLDQGEYYKYLEDYLPHFYVQNEQYGSALSKFIKDSPNAKARIIPTFAEAVRMGFRPISQDPAVLYELYNQVNWRVAMNRRLVGEIAKMRTPDDKPVIQPAGEAPDNWIPLEAQSLFKKIVGRQLKGTTAAPSKTLLWETGVKAHPDVYYAIRQMLERPISAPARWYDWANSFTRGTAFMLSGFHDVSLAFASLGAQFRFSSPNPARGLWRFFERDPVSGERLMQQSAPAAGRRLLQAEGAVTDAAQHGLRFSWADSAVFEYSSRHAVDQTLQWAQKLPGFKNYPPLTRWLRDAHKWRHENLWSKTHDALKILAYHDILTKSLERATPNTDVTMLKERIASFLNDAFGGQDWQTQFWASPYVRRVWGRFMLAPDWTASTVRSIPGFSDLMTRARTKLLPGKVQGQIPASYEGLQGNMMRLKFWGAEVSAVALSTIAIQWAIAQYFGDPQKGDHEWMWENEPGKSYLGDTRYNIDVTPIMRKLAESGLIKWAQDMPVLNHLVPEEREGDKTRHYVNMGKRAAEVMRWFMNPMENIESKLSRPVAELAKQLTGREGEFAAEWKQEDTAWEPPLRIMSVLKNLAPFTLTGNQFAMTQPMKKGMTRYKAQDAFEAIFEIQADPNAASRWLRTLSMGRPRVTAVSDRDIQSMIEQVSDATERNGINSSEPLNDAHAKVMSYHMSAFSKAFVKWDAAVTRGDKRGEAHFQEIMDDEQRYMDRLGYTGRGIKQSIKNQYRMDITPTPANIYQQPQPAPTAP